MQLKRLKPRNTLGWFVVIYVCSTLAYGLFALGLRELVRFIY